VWDQSAHREGDMGNAKLRCMAFLFQSSPRFTTLPSKALVHSIKVRDGLPIGVGTSTP